MKMPSLKQVPCVMKASLFVLFACILLSGAISAAVPPQGIVWHSDLDQAVALAEQTKRLLFIHFYGDNCPPCKLMDSTVFTDPSVIASINRDFIAVKVHTAKQPALGAKFNVKAIPTDIVLKPNGQMLHRRQGGITQERFIAYTAFLVDKAKAESPELYVSAATAPPALPPIVPTTTPTHQSAVAPSIPQQTSVPPALQENPGLRDPFTKQVVTPPPQPQPPTPSVTPAAPQAVTSMPPIMPGPTQNSMLPPIVSAPIAPPAADSFPSAPTVTEPTPGVYAPPVLHVAQPPMFREPPPGPPSNMNEVPKTTVEVPLGLEGYCPVILSREERWVPGNPAYYTMFRGHVFRFSSEEAMAEFAKAPLNFSPVAMGEDIVQMVNRNKKVYGNRKFGVWYQGRVFLFNNQESLDAFAERPEYYAEIAIKYETAFKGVHGLF